MKNLNNVLLKPVAILFATVLLLVATIYLGSAKITKLISTYNESSKLEASLNKKFNILRDLNTTVPDDTNFLNMAVPYKNSVLLGMNQIKSQSLIDGITISNIKTSTLIPMEKNIFKSSISFEAEGEKNSIYSFLDAFSKTLPIFKIEKIKFSNTELSTKVDVTLNVFSSEAPKSIPSLVSDINVLTDEEIILIEEMSKYELPERFASTPADIESKPNPFE